MTLTPADPDPPSDCHPMTGYDLLTNCGPSDPNHNWLPPMSLVPRPLPACPPGAGVGGARGSRIHTHAQLQQEEGWSERKEHWTTTRD